MKCYCSPGKELKKSDRTNWRNKGWGPVQPIQHRAGQRKPGPFLISFWFFRVKHVRSIGQCSNLNILAMPMVKNIISTYERYNRALKGLILVAALSCWPFLRGMWQASLAFSPLSRTCCCIGLAHHTPSLCPVHASEPAQPWNHACMHVCHASGYRNSLLNSMTWGKWLLDLKFLIACMEKKAFLISLHKLFRDKFNMF